MLQKLRERREGYAVKVIPTINGCLGGGMKELKVSIVSDKFLNTMIMITN